MRRDIGFIGLTFVAVSAMVGSGWLFAPLLASQAAGPAAIVAWAIGGFAILLLALTYAEISAMLPVTGGIARVPQFSHGNVVSTAMGWSAWIGYNATAPVEVEAMLRYLALHLPWLYEADNAGALTDKLSWAGTTTATGFLVLFTVINAIGVKFFTYVNSTITWVKIAIPLIVIFAFIVARFEPSNFVADGFSPFGLQGILAAVSSGGIIFSYIGFRHAVDMAGEVKRPGVIIPLALLSSIAICFVLYAGLQLAFVGALSPADLAGGWKQLASAGGFGPLEVIASAIGLIWLVSLLNVGAVLGPFGGGLVTTGSNARLTYALAENGFFPRLFATLSARGVPLRGLILNLVFSSLIFLLLPFEEIVKLNSSAIMLSFIAGPIGVVALRHLLPHRNRPLRLPAVEILAPVAFVIATLVLYWSGWDTLWRLGLYLLAGLVLFLIHMGRDGLANLDLVEAAWLPPYLIALGLVSAFGSFGGSGHIPFGWDMILLFGLSLATFQIAVRCRLPQERLNRYLSEERIFEKAESEPPSSASAILD
ncbi:APC family permease [Pseudorhodoplanes sinuspersici]|uniref:Amino acid permease n=1 Tax=Pseudorhodoplanes sinuspersici TaxID=1235591 RepID=A0A1W6ZUJ1_9HYPH|nr:APC family permease [Pseudorhodoplanes sinuspersici]ARQ01099.1 amino acid permease [Pseudorhodoplanes sinuspersici]RKE72748.1 amino acid/polyamine/organocation transporter (APC superfamily) [Pseudorhodoplanes sinuspersici]